jgi:hypothetical protein
LFIADSHTEILLPSIQQGITEVVSFDAHHDAGYHSRSLADAHKGIVDCGNWILHCRMAGVSASVWYPPWKKWAIEEPPEIALSRGVDDGRSWADVPFDRVFLCRSGAWTPPWLDDKFVTLISTFPRQKRFMVGPIVVGIRRPWNEKQVGELAAQETKAMAEFAKQRKETTCQTAPLASPGQGKECQPTK